ncbi:UbiA family prenyltransferase [Streptomyces sp. S465]|nr:UbiA family prenyltransferase [Streptomyces sp. S465]WAP59079.1 UbiA family prenyltransferase [Streptomyces sp. S465]
MTRAVGTWGDWAELLRVSALFTVPGDALAGAAAAGRGPNRGTALAVCASLCLYEAGMALNDWADRDVDAVERPGRPLPSGRIAPVAALTAATGLTAAGLACAAAAGRPALATATALAGTVWAYDLGLKNTPAGPPAMAATRALDLLLGATASAGHLRPALRPAVLLGAHTLAVTTVSRREAVGGSSTAPLGALAAAAAIAWTATRHPPRPAATPTGAGPDRVVGRHAAVAAAPGATAPERGPAAGVAVSRALARLLSQGAGKARRGGPSGGLAEVVLVAPAPMRGSPPGGRRTARRPSVGPDRVVGRSAAVAAAAGVGSAVGRRIARAGGQGARARRGGPSGRLAGVVLAAPAPMRGSPPGGRRTARRPSVGPDRVVGRSAVVAAAAGVGSAVGRRIARAGGQDAQSRRGGPSGRLAGAAVAGMATGVAKRHAVATARTGRGGSPAGWPARRATPGARAWHRTRSTSRFAAVAGAVLAGGYVATVARPLAHAALNPSPYLLQRAVGSGIRATIPLQAVLASRAGAHRTAAGLLALVPVARRLARKVSAT